MLNFTLYKREMKGSVKLLVIFSMILTLYISIIISMYDPEKMAVFDGFVEALPELMAAVGMKAGATTLLNFMSSYLYGFILLIFPLVFCSLRGNALLAKYIDSGAMVSLVAAPVKRVTIAFTQMCVLISGIFFLIAYSTLLEIICAEKDFPGALDIKELLLLNAGLLCLHLLVGAVSFFASCLFSNTKYSVGFGAGIPFLMYVPQMLSNMGGDMGNAKYFTFFTLFNPDGMIRNESGAMAGVIVLLIGAALLYATGIIIFHNKDLYL